MSEMGEFWRDVKAARQEKRADNRQQSAQMLLDAGIAFESKNLGAHLIVRAAGHTYDFWPGTGLWMMRGSPKRHGGGIYGDEGDVHHVISGPSPRDSAVSHAVVGCNGEVVFDPHPSRAGLAGDSSKWQHAYLVRA